MPVDKPKAKPLSKADAEYIEYARTQIGVASSLDELAALGDILKGETKTRQDALRGAYGKRKKELEETE